MSGVREGKNPDILTFKNSRTTGTGRDIRFRYTLTCSEERTNYIIQTILGIIQ